MGQYRLFGGTLLTPEGPQKADLLLRGKAIEAVLPSDAAVSGDYLPVDCTGLYISPGFVDIHQHGGGGSDYMDPDPENYFRAVQAHLAHGTTSIMPTTLAAGREATAGAVKRYVQAAADPRIRDRLLGLHMEGPYISPAQAGAQKPEHLRVFEPAEYRRLTQLGGNLKVTMEDCQTDVEALCVDKGEATLIVNGKEV